MVISDSKKFIFVHIEKTGGSSIRHAIEPFAIPRPVRGGRSLMRVFDLPRDYRRFRFRAHAPLSDAERKMPESAFSEYFKFAFVRNPWDRLVSEYNAALSKGERARHRRLADLEDFEAFIRYEIRRNKFQQAPRLRTRCGALGVNFIGRFETLQRDFAAVCERLDVLVELEHLNRHAHPDYRDYYDAGTRDLVYRYWRDDIDRFGYEF